MDENETCRLDVEHGSIDNPLHCSHKRGKNWGATLVGKNAANMDRDFWRKSGRELDVSKLRVGDAFEIGGDYVTSGGNRRPDRLYGVAVEITDEAVAYQPFKSAAKAMKARLDAYAKAGRAPDTVSAQETIEIAAKAAEAPWG